MRWWAIGVAGLLAASGATVRCLDAEAQQVSPVSDAASDDRPAPDGPPAPHRMLGWQSGRTTLAQGPATIGLLYTAPDRKLSQDDVRRIAEAFLLWHGNHEWRVTQLASDADHVTFSIATAQNTVIAGFSMDRHTGMLNRTS